jgi:SAM-dependent methyltransferase
MKAFGYVKYFLYIAWHWNMRLAWFTVTHEIKGEKKYGIETTPLNNLKNLSLKGNIEGAEIYQGANYFLLEKVFSFLDTIEGSKNIIDFGCGKGRVMVVAAHYNFNKITGIDFAKELCDEAINNMIPIQKRFPEKIFNVIHINAAEHTIEDDTNVFFFFNPFDEVIMLKVVKNILASLKKNEREIYVVYVNPVHKEIFLSAGFEEIYYFEKFYYIQGCVLQKSPEDFGAD